jgi:hypothetical protein
VHVRKATGSAAGCSIFAANHGLNARTAGAGNDGMAYMLLV